MKHLATVILSLSIALASCAADVRPVSDPVAKVVPEVLLEVPGAEIGRTRLKAKEALAYCKSKEFNTERCILIDMSLHSGVNRFFVYDFVHDTVIHSCLVAHGCCDGPWGSDDSRSAPVFSNVSGSHCSSLGRYRIGERGYSSWGVNIKYLLHGLDPTNSNALARTIVFHSWEEVGDEEVYPRGTPEG